MDSPNHFLLMAVYAAIVAVFFATLTRRQRRDQIRLFLLIFFGLVGGGVALAWLMSLVPAGPPAPIP
ncbi:MAG: hypothetical protein AAGN46_09940 [Acidobacteriota bacterium]